MTRKTPKSIVFCAALSIGLGACDRGSSTDSDRSTTPGSTGKPRYTVGVDREFPPYAFVDERGRIAGFTVDLTHAVAGVMDFEVELVTGTYDEIVAALEGGEVDFVPHLVPTPELEQKFAFTLSHLEARDAIFVRADATRVFTQAHLHDLPTLVWQAGAVDETFRRDNVGGRILNEASVAETLRRLAAGEGDCALVPHRTGISLIGELGLANLRLAGPEIKDYTRSLSFAVRRDRPELLERLDQGLTLVTTTRRYPELFHAWFGSQEPAISPQTLRRWLLWVSVPLLGLVAAGIVWSASLRRTVARRTAALRESEERLGGILDNAPMAIYMKDREGRYLVVNRRFEELVGRPRHQMQHLTDSSLFEDPYVAELRAAEAEVLETGEVVRSEETLPTPQGPRILHSVRFPLHGADGRVHAICAINADVTDQKRAEDEKRDLEAQMQQAQKLESLGILAGGIAHDFNNLLLGILGNAGLAILELDPDSPARPLLRDVEAAGQRAAELCQQMLAYSGKGKFVVEPLDLSQLVVDMTHLIEASVSKKAKLERELAEPLPAFEADASQIRQVVMNLIINASEALGDGSGTITVRTGVEPRSADALRRTYLAEDLAAGDYVFLEVADDGVGMDPETRERIFDPFFSTKFTGRGLGLAATLGVVRGHRGALEVESAPGKGTVFRVLFPAAGGPVQPMPATSAAVFPVAEAGAEVGGTILVVDDESVVLRVARQVLERAGYRVLTAGDGEEGLDVFRHHAREISLVLLDVTMPQMNGDEAFRQMRRLKSDVRVLVTSGYDERDATSDLSGPGLAGFIQKPYAPAALLRKVREAMS